MMGQILKFMNNVKQPKMETILPEECLIVDVRTTEEFAQGHYKSSINIPLNLIMDHISDFKLAGRPIVLVCRSGMRSSNAVKMLQSNGISAINGGPWDSLNT